jgi:hypothetical protein
MAEFEQRDLAESDPSQYSASSEHKSFAIGASVLFVIGVAIGLSWFAWGYFERIGWIAQTRVIEAHMSGSGLTSEYRPCQTDGTANILFCVEPGEAQSALSAHGQVLRSVSVRFYGNITGKPEAILKWQCKREAESISCHALR